MQLAYIREVPVQISAGTLAILSPFVVFLDPCRQIPGKEVELGRDSVVTVNSPILVINGS
jgi:hypothetical protein